MENITADQLLQAAKLIAEAIDRNTEQLSNQTQAVRQMRDHIEGIEQTLDKIQEQTDPNRNSVY